MDTKTFDRFIQRCRTLTVQQRRKLADTMLSLDAEHSVLVQIDERGRNLDACPHCGGQKLTRWGSTRKGLMRQRCGQCLCTFSSATDTAINRVRKIEKFYLLSRNMLEEWPRSCRDMASELGVDKMTIWRWRHRIMEAILEVGEADLAGIVEADEKFFRESRKGSREWVNNQRFPHIYPAPNRLRWEDYRRLRIKNAATGWQMSVLTMTDRSGGRRADVLFRSSAPNIVAKLQSHINSQAVLCSDADPVYRMFAAQAVIPHYALNSKTGPRVINNVFHIQTINSLHQRFQRFMDPFRGPATKNLAKYTAWFIARSTKDPSKTLANAWEMILAV